METETTTQQQPPPQPQQQQQQQEPPLVFVVTALYNGGDPVSPQIVGVYTTQERALENARCFFESHAETYQDGKFIKPSSVYDHIKGQEDLSDSLVLRENAPCMRVFLEVGNDDNLNGIVVAINAMHMGNNNNCSVSPQKVSLLSAGNNGRNFGSLRVQETPESFVVCEQEKEKEKKVLVLMDAHGGYEHGEQEDVNLLGVFFENYKDDAIKLAKKCFDKEIRTLCQFDDVGEIKDNTETIVERGIVISRDGAPAYGIAMDTIVLDKTYVPVVYPDNDDDEEYDDEEENSIVPKAGDELQFGCASSGLYYHPEIYFTIKTKDNPPPAYSKSSANKRPVVEVSPEKEDVNKDDNNNSSNKKPKVIAGSKRLCTACKTDKIQHDFSNRQWGKGDSTRRCKKCLGNSNYKHA